VIDRLQSRFVHSLCCVLREVAVSPRVGVVVPLLLLVMGSGSCSPKSTPRTVEDSVTSGRIRIVCATEAYGLMSRENAVFESSYPQATIEMTPGSSREAVRALFAAECDMAVISRELRPEERRAATMGKLELEGYRFARNAVVLIVHPSNPVENLALDDLRRVFRGDARSWSDLGGPPLPVTPVVQPGTADVTEFFVEEALGGEPIRAQALTAANDSLVVEQVARTPGAIGYVTLCTPVDRVKVLRAATLKGLPYWRPDLEAIYRGDYPLTRFYNLYVRAGGKQLANGLVTFVTSIDGQRLVREAGLVPTSVPVRFVRRSPMLSTHSRGDSTSTP